MSAASTIRAIIIDDEPLARKRIQSMLRPHTDIEVIAECSNGSEALSIVREKSPDLLFLDIQMPAMDGFEFLQQLDLSRIPFVIFVTAHDEYAVKAFDIHALDYILKPFTRERFEQALKRAKWALSRHDTAVQDQLKMLLRELGQKEQYLDRILVKVAGQEVVVRTDEIDWIEARDNYIGLHVGKHLYLVRETLSGFEQKLNPKKFARIHRSTIVNTSRVERLEPSFQNNSSVILRDGTRLTLSRIYRKNLRRLFGEVL
jgi:two-component system LytT family response regulator